MSTMNRHRLDAFNFLTFDSPRYERISPPGCGKWITNGLRDEYALKYPDAIQGPPAASRTCSAEQLAGWEYVGYYERPAQTAAIADKPLTATEVRHRQYQAMQRFIDESIIALCCPPALLSAAPKLEDQPTTAQVESTQKPEQDTERDRQQDEAARREIEANAGMLKRDSDGDAPVRMRPVFELDELTDAEVREIKENANRLMRERLTSAHVFIEPDFDHRLGRWGAVS